MKSKEKIINMATGSMIGILFYMLVNKYVEPLLSNWLGIYIADKSNEQAVRASKVEQDLGGYDNNKGVEMGFKDREDDV